MCSTLILQLILKNKICFCMKYLLYFTHCRERLIIITIKHNGKTDVVEK